MADSQGGGDNVSFDESCQSRLSRHSDMYLMGHLLVCLYSSSSCQYDKVICSFICHIRDDTLRFVNSTHNSQLFCSTLSVHTFTATRPLDTSLSTSCQSISLYQSTDLLHILNARIGNIAMDLGIEYKPLLTDPSLDFSDRLDTRRDEGVNATKDRLQRRIRILSSICIAQSLLLLVAAVALVLGRKSNDVVDLSHAQLLYCEFDFFASSMSRD